MGTKAVIIPRVFGGLGNQLFIYATARRIALVNDAELVIDHVTGFENDHKYNRKYELDHFNIPCSKATRFQRLEPLPRVRRYIKRVWGLWQPFERRKYIRQSGVDFDSRILNVNPVGYLYIEGYWQSERYFKDVEIQIRDELRIISPKDDQNIQMAEKIQSGTSVAVHVRFFDAPKINGKELNAYNNVTSDYYNRAVSVMDEKVPHAHYYIFSDRPLDAVSMLNIPNDRVTVVCHNNSDEMAYADLWLMSLCNNFIIANSTFSWWGAWLAKNRMKVVIAPAFVKRTGASSWGFDGLLPESWIKL